MITAAESPEDHLDIVVPWVYSVCRHVARADWVYHRDSGLPKNALMPVFRELAADGNAVFEIEGLPHGYDHAFIEELVERDVEGDEWFFFSPDGPSPKSPLYLRTKALIEQRLGRPPWPTAAPSRARRRQKQKAGRGLGGCLKLVLAAVLLALAAVMLLAWWSESH